VSWPSKLAYHLGAFLLNLLVACLGTRLVVTPFDRALKSADIFHVILKSDLLSGVAAFGLGWFVYHTRGSVTAKWVWIFGLCFFSYGAIHFLQEPISSSVLHPRPRHSLYWEMSGLGCRSDLDSCRDWGLYTLQLLRTMSFSAGAVCCTAYSKSLRSKRIGQGEPSRV